MADRGKSPFPLAGNHTRGEAAGDGRESGLRLASASPVGEEQRSPDRIDTGPRYSETDAIRLNHMFRGRDTVEMLEILLKENMLGDAAIVSSFGAESAVLLHLIASIDPSVPVLFLDTGKIGHAACRGRRGGGGGWGAPPRGGCSRRAPQRP